MTQRKLNVTSSSTMAALSALNLKDNAFQMSFSDAPTGDAKNLSHPANETSAGLKKLNQLLAEVNVAAKKNISASIEGALYQLTRRFGELQGEISSKSQSGIFANIIKNISANSSNAKKQMICDDLKVCEIYLQALRAFSEEKGEVRSVLDVLIDTCNNLADPKLKNNIAINRFPYANFLNCLKEIKADGLANVIETALKDEIIARLIAANRRFLKDLPAGSHFMNNYGCRHYNFRKILITRLIDSYTLEQVLRGNVPLQPHLDVTSKKNVADLKEMLSQSRLTSLCDWVEAVSINNKPEMSLNPVNRYDDGYEAYFTITCVTEGEPLPEPIPMPKNLASSWTPKSLSLSLDLPLTSAVSESTSQVKSKSL